MTIIAECICSLSIKTNRTLPWAASHCGSYIIYSKAKYNSEVEWCCAYAYTFRQHYHVDVKTWYGLASVLVWLRSWQRSQRSIFRLVDTRIETLLKCLRVFLASIICPIYYWLGFISKRKKTSSELSTLDNEVKHRQNIQGGGVIITLSLPLRQVIYIYSHNALLMVMYYGIQYHQ